uniref:Conserved oligomeric Golgi complex subunit 1-like n=1 Tax=Rhizophora mucronata TaxID=61149 RepID=A0A2P2MZJ1_RHIMU
MAGHEGLRVPYFTAASPRVAASWSRNCGSWCLRRIRAAPDIWMTSLRELAISDSSHATATTTSSGKITGFPSPRNNSGYCGTHWEVVESSFER